MHRKLVLYPKMQIMCTCNFKSLLLRTSEHKRYISYNLGQLLMQLMQNEPV